MVHRRRPAPGGRGSDDRAARRVTVVGEALVDIVDDGSPREIPGGSPANVALGLGRLGVPVEFVTWLGDDARGQHVADHLRASGVSLADGAFGASRTSTAAVRCAPDGQPSYDLALEWDLPVVPEVPDRLHVGSVGAFLRPGADAVLELTRRTAAAGGRVSFDPNVRPALFDDAAGARARFDLLAIHADVVKLSDEDAAWLFPGASTDVVLDRLHALGVRLAVLTAGAAGSVLSTVRDRVRVLSERVDVVDTVGAGDSYTAALLWQLDGPASQLDALQRSDLTELGLVSARAAAMTVGRRGADLPTADEVLSVARGPLDGGP